MVKSIARQAKLQAPDSLTWIDAAFNDVPRALPLSQTAGNKGWWRWVGWGGGDGKKGGRGVGGRYKLMLPVVLLNCARVFESRLAIERVNDA